jgi:hypothetical protein
MSTTIGEQLRTRLRDAIGQDHTTIGADVDGTRIAVDAEHCERYATGVRGVSVRPAAPLVDVGGAAERIAHDVDAVDQLAVVEYDANEQQAILRSAEPQADEEGVTYWEASVKPDEATFHRYHKAHAVPDREQVAEPITHRDLGKLADQIVDALNGGIDD